MVSAFVIHELPGRLRLRIPERRGDAVFFAELAERLTECPGVTSVESNLLTGSLLLFHALETGMLEIARYSEQSALFRIEPSSATAAGTLSQRAVKGFDGLDRSLAAASGGLVDLQSGFLLLLLGLALYQLRQGRILAPAISLFWEAIKLAGPDKIRGR